MSEVSFRTAYGPKLVVDTHPVGESMAKQAFKAECDVNNIMKRFERTGVMEHAAKYEGRYGDFTEVGDYQTAMQAVVEAREAFESLPAQLRARFGNDPGAFLGFIEDPENIEEARKMGLVKAAVEPAKSLAEQVTEGLQKGMALQKSETPPVAA